MSEFTVAQEQVFDTLITRILARFASGTNSEVDAHIQASLGEIAEFMGVDYALVVRTAHDLSSWKVAYEWCSQSAPSRIMEYQHVPMGTWDFNERVILSGEVLQLDRMEDVPANSADVRQFMEAMGFKSTLQVPTRRPGGQISGCLAMISLVQEVTWSDADVQRLRLAAEAIASAIERAQVEWDLRKSEARFRATFEHAPLGILNISPTGCLLQANHEFCRMLGYCSDEICGRQLAEFSHPDEARAMETTLCEFLAQPHACTSIEQRFLHRSGRVVWTQAIISRMRGSADDEDIAIATIADITDRKMAEDTIDAVPDLVFVADRQRRIVRANLATAERLGIPRLEVLGRSCEEVIHGPVTSSDPASHQHLAADGQPHHFETHQPHLKGHFLVSCTPLRDKCGEFVGTVHVARDITALRESEAALRRAHEQLAQRRALVTAASLDGVWEWEVTGGRVQYSERFAELVGYAAEQVPQTLDFFASILHPDDSELLWESVNRHLREGHPHDVECRLRTKGGEYRWFRTRGRTQRDADDRPTWMAGSLQDIHDQKAAEMKLRSALSEVERLSDRLRAENVYLQDEITNSLGFDEIIGESQPLRNVLTQVEHVAETDASVLLLGETGTGKELLARAIHERSTRKQRPMVKVNLAALPLSLIESELFGHVKGAFTGAVTDKIGRFALADGGTLFLDEIGELDPELQTKLLRVLQEGEFERIGSAETKRVDVRIVAATNRDLRRAVEQCMFRADLYYRLAVFPIEIPPLRLRRDDIPLLTWHFIAKKQKRLGKSIERVPPEVMESLLDYDWPGNIRELENVVERAMILAPGSELTLNEPTHGVRGPTPVPRWQERKGMDRSEILRVLERTGWKIKGAGNAAERLGLKPSTLRYRMKKLGIARPAGSA